MYNTFFFVALFAATHLFGAAIAFSIDTPEFTQCQPARVSWSHGQSPYHLVIVDSKDPCGDVILDLGDFNETSITWTVQLPENAAVTLYVEDSGYEDAWSGSIIVSASNDQTCIPASVRQYYKITSTSTSTTSTSTSTSSSAGTASSGTPVVTPTLSKTTNNNPSVSPIGAANAGNNPLKNGATSMRYVGTPLTTIGALVAAILLIP